MHHAMNEYEAVATSQGIPRDKNEEQSDQGIKNGGCGLGECTPKWFQVFNNPKCLLVCLTAYSIVHGFLVMGVQNANATSYERRFTLSSFHIAMISSAFDITAGIVVVFIGFMGTTGHKPRLIALAALISAFGAFLGCLPHFLTGPYEYSDTTGDISRDTYTVPNNSVGTDKDEESSLHNYIYMFAAAQMLCGIGGATLYSLGPVYLDENVDTNSSPLYIGIFYSLGIIGPALGYMLGGYLLTIYVDFLTIEPSTLELTPNDPRWVGAWWIGFLATGVLLLVSSLLMGCFPKRLKDADNLSAHRVSQAHQPEHRSTLPGFGFNIRHLPRQALRLFGNAPFVFMTLGSSVDGMVGYALAVFGPKFVQFQLAQSSGMSAIISGSATIVGTASGVFIGGFIANRMKLKVAGLIRFIIIVNVAFFIPNAIMWCRCTPTNFAGVSSHRHPSGDGPVLTQSCNANSSCTTEFYSPICSQRGERFFSACHAGCESVVNDTNFYDCSCIDSEGFNDTLPTATAGQCETPCQLLPVFVVGAVVLTFTLYSAATPVTTTLLRCVDDSERSLAMGIYWFFMRFLGCVPGPLLFGYVIDTSCIVWQDMPDGTTGSCWVYDSFKFSLNCFLLASAIKVVSGVLYSLALYSYKPPKDGTFDSDGDKCVSEAMI